MNIHIINETKFKSITFTLKIARRFDDFPSYRAFLSFLLFSCSDKYPKYKFLSRKLDDLYGALLESSISSKGNLHIITLNLAILDPKYANDEIFYEACDLIYELLYHPNLNLYSNQYQNYKTMLESLEDDSNSYSLERLFSIMGRDSILSKSTYGSIQELSTISKEDMIAYMNSIQDDYYDLIVVGDIKNHHKEYLENKFVNNQNMYSYDACLMFQARDVERVEEVKEITQTHLLLGYATNTTYVSDNYASMVMLNGLLGEFSQSILFQILREKEGLCYEISSTFDEFNGILVIQAGIDYEDVDIVLKHIEDAFNIIKQGLFSDQLIEDIKKLYITSSLIANDDIDNLSTKYYERLITNKTHSIEELKKVDKQMIIDACNRLELDTIYILKGDSNGD